MQTDSHPETPMRWIRREVFQMDQDAFADVAKVSRPRISRYENGDDPPHPVMRRIRTEAQRRGLTFSGDWFFEVPPATPVEEGATPEPVTHVRAAEDVQ